MRILITAGATWIRVDDVRILTSRFTGKTGLYMARQLRKYGHDITLLINPHCVGGICPKHIRIVPFHYFDELKNIVVKELKNSRYDAIIHNAAVSDYKVTNVARGKIPSRKKSCLLRLVPTEKLIPIMRNLAKEAVIIQFKLESTVKGIVQKAYKSLKENGSDFVVANALSDLKRGYKARIIDSGKKVFKVDSQEALMEALAQRVGTKRV